jgi:hypothetical protein
MIDRRLQIGCLVLLLGLLAGCSSQGPAVVPVSGRVTLDGQPLADATLSFQPITDKSSTTQPATGSYGKTDADGRYTLRLIEPDQPGAIVGKHAVTVTTAVAANPASDEIKLKQPEVLPLAARTREIDVPPGGTEQADIELKSK